MPTFTVDVGVALTRPPTHDATITFAIEASSGDAAELLACQWASGHPRVSMPVWSVVTEWIE